LTGLLWGVVVVAMLMAAVAAETTARWWLRHRRRYYVLPPGLRIRTYPDPKVFPHLEQVTRFEVNLDGERGDEVPRSVDGLYRVLVGGGSQPEGFFLDQDTAWPGALQRLLEKPEHLDRLGASNVHVGSIARSGVGSEALDLVFARTLPRYPRLQLIVIGVGVTDVMRWLEQGAPRVLAPVRTADVFRCHPEGPFGWTTEGLAIVELLKRARRRWLRPVTTYKKAGQWLGDARTMRARATQIRTAVPDAAPMLDHFERHFRRLLQTANAHADRVLVVRQPWFAKNFSPEEAAHMWHGGVGQAWREEVTTYYSFEVFSALMSLLDSRAAAVAAALHVEHLDLMPILDRSLATYYDGFHLTPAGARTVATAVAAAVLRQPIPQAKRRPAFEEARAVPQRVPVDSFASPAHPHMESGLTRTPERRTRNRNGAAAASSPSH
jgi:lysophospholipase L1-like esterase